MDLLVREGWEPPKVKKDKKTNQEEPTVTTKRQSDLAMIKEEPEEIVQEGAWGQQSRQEVQKEQTKEERIRVLVAHRPNIPTTQEQDIGRAERTQNNSTLNPTTTRLRVVGTITEIGVTTSQKVGAATPTRRDLSPCQKEGHFPCEGCGREYKHKRNLIRHIKEQHQIVETDSSEEEGEAILCRDSSLMGNRQVLKCVKLTDRAHIPTRGTYRSVGHDLYSAYEYTISAGGRALVKTDLQIAMPPGCYGRIASRSSLAHFHGIHVGAGVIDPDYRGNVGVVLFNLSSQDYVVKQGDRCAQIILEQAYVPFIVEVKSLPETSRGTGSFGSTGKGENKD